MNIALNILKKFWREILIVGLFAFCILSVRQCSVNDTDLKLVINANDSLFNVANYYVNKNDQLTAQVKTHEGTTRQWKEFSDELGFENEKLKKQIGNESRLVAHWKGKASINPTTIEVPLINTMDGSMDLDSEFHFDKKAIYGNKNFDWNNKYMSIHGNIDFDSNKVSITYDYKFDFEITAYYKPQGLFKKQQLVTDVIFSDQSLRVREFKGFVVKQPEIGFFQTRVGQITLTVGGFGAGYLLGRATAGN